MPAFSFEGKEIPVNPYLSPCASSTHYDHYNSDVADTPAPSVPAGEDPAAHVKCVIYPKKGAPAQNGYVTTPFFDLDKHPINVVDGSKRIVLREAGNLDQILGSYQSEEAGGQPEFAIAPAYMNIAADSQILVPTTDGCVLILQTQKDGVIQSSFPVLANFPVIEAIAKQRGDERPVYPKLIASIYDFSGNLWFATGDVRIVPDDAAVPPDAAIPPSAIGYIPAEIVAKYLSLKGAADPDKEAVEKEFAAAMHYFVFEQQAWGNDCIVRNEGLENGIAVDTDRVIAMTNFACYSFPTPERLGDGEFVPDWRQGYESDGIKGADKEDGQADPCGGLGWGSGATPTIANDLVLFSDNGNPLRLYALDKRTGAVRVGSKKASGAAEHCFFSEIGQDGTVRIIPEIGDASIDTSLLVYGPTPERTSIIALNTYGIYNTTFRYAPFDTTEAHNIYASGYADSANNAACRKGLERVDVIFENGVYTTIRRWLRTDIASSVVPQLSTVTGLVYIYDCDEDDEWRFHALDFDTGDTAFTFPVGKGMEYQNRGTGVMLGPDGCVYVPTRNHIVALCEKSCQGDANGSII